MVSRGYEAVIAERSNWVTDRPHRLIGAAWYAVLVVAVLMTIQTATFILHNGLMADRPPLSMFQTGLRVALVLGATVCLLVRRDLIERAALITGILAPGSSALFGLGLRSPLLAALRLLSHLALYALAAVVAWRVLVAMHREIAAHR
jgi:hypothetical protein